MFIACATNPLTGQRTMAFVSNRELFPSAFAMYDEFLNENTVVTGTPEAQMLNNVGNRLAEAALKWLTAEGYGHYLDDYQWEFTLIQDDTVNAWALPGGKIVFYTGIMPVAQTEAGIAVIMGHEISHALLNHGQQRMSAGVLQEIGMVGVAVATGGLSQETQSLAMSAYGVGSELLGTMPFGRRHELEADEYGLILMAIAGYDPAEGARFWERMAALTGGGSGPQFFSTHPSGENRIRQLQELEATARQKAAEFGVTF